MKIARWGNSLAVRIPAAVVEELDLKEGDEIELTREPGSDALQVKRKSDLEDAMAALKKLNRSLPAGFKFDREEANER